MSKINNLGDRLAHLSPPLTKFLSMPVRYQAAVDTHLYESARMVNIAFEFVFNNKVFGDYCEFGAYEGNTTREAFFAAKRFGVENKMSFHIYDSFEGLPECEGVFNTGQFACSLPKFKNNLERWGVDQSRFEITKGWFDQTLNSDRLFPVSVAWIDCDIYSSTVPVLEFLTPRLIDGAVICFDDWFSLDKEGGEKRACEEWIFYNHLTEYQNFHWCGKSFIFRRP